MHTHNNWVGDNLNERFSHRSVDFKVQLIPRKFVPDSFANCSANACRMIAAAYKNIHIALSGGMDSEYVVRAFHRCNVPFTAIIVVCGEQVENLYAYRLCKELSIAPKIISVTEAELIRHFNEHISGRLNGVGYSATQVAIAAEYVQKVGGSLVTGDHFLGDGDDMVSDEVFALANEWDFYINHLFPESNNISFFLHTPELAYSMLPTEHIEWNIFKSNLYGIAYRPKMRPSYSRSALYMLRAINHSRASTNKVSLVYGKEQFLSFFNPI
jgi:hypothetical protein